MDFEEAGGRDSVELVGFCNREEYFTQRLLHASLTGAKSMKEPIVNFWQHITVQSEG